VTYLNRADVQMAIHANMSLPYKWSECSNVLNYSRESLLTSMLPVYNFLFEVSSSSSPSSSSTFVVIVVVVILHIRRM
jgi:hypothetical protein